jgi:hypothetical protein
MAGREGVIPHPYLRFLLLGLLLFLFWLGVVVVPVFIGIASIIPAGIVAIGIGVLILIVWLSVLVVFVLVVG